MRVLFCLTAAWTMFQLNSATLPAHSWDSHIHIIDPDRFPLDPAREYTPKPATAANATTFQKKVGQSHFVIVLPSFYGCNNSVLLDALNHFNGTARGVAVVDPHTVSNETLATLNATGVVGLRINQGGDETPEEVIQRVKDNAVIARQWDWALELWIDLKIFQQLHAIIPDLGVRVVADHFAHARVASASNQTSSTIDPYTIPGFTQVIDLVSRRLLFVKISAPYQNSKLYPYYQDLEAVARALIANGPDMVVWGSDWPHTISASSIDPADRMVPQNFRDVDDMAMILQTMQYASSKEQIQRMFVDNPRRLWKWYDSTT
ncbi:hypothetical protein AYL99_09299 [Fonsecaea erecta]|uniref:Amidohydrolase-related domain-containing protein n=1 Tax=Fonsecaea erecta TaxID=1367422 RepID=A0A178Z8L2_9EURO|nr:hypothetical protein AYL99_09299 [Fonsecaea erecta]OAP56120.1 hypothetical protein AYL99_09299 [Fonsecaea erecta]